MQAQKILLIDDESEIRECVRLMVSRQGNYEFHQAADGEKGLEMILSGEYACVVSDIKMPEMDGVSMLKRVRAAGNNVPMVFISAFADEEFNYQVTDFGAVKLINKVDIKEVGSRILEAIKVGQDTKEIKANNEVFGDEFLKLLNNSAIK